MSDSLVLYEKKGPIAIVTINRPEKMNVYNGEVCVLLGDAFCDFRDDPSLYVAILTGAGERAFCAGADMRGMVPPKEGEPAPIPFPRGRMFHEGDIKVYKPIVAAINGYCLSGGLCHALQCDIRIAAENATFGLQQVRFGAQSPASTHLLARNIGMSNAMYLSLTGARIDAEEALRMGIIHKIVPLKDLMSAAHDMADTLLDNCPTHLRARKEHLLRGYNLPYDEARAMGGYLESQVPAEERSEGITAFFEKRKPDWSKIPK
jgi:enoyl-CoA hydratase/carnithine racemase